ncbi:BZ3500_MvSof-1268-A1-R1_Chr11-3g03594 [Microbotryum saponariae]|uniref:BZ3500_MvSof-1268-A1-R1_Chr11-3g03594 protein n=1 Tax=Microbotryum saponariae TaxID=289078 RepID=A0A2X0LW40_9BASI|nr:BZ3500_MvSof-1268-A1-R1_Chr11-3g03594 [Microbotryum saponariae]SDA03603.1 BZ3501_MvSof-1269-A2-R1_Chr11g03171 [Microbotryum saponariae]
MQSQTDLYEYHTYSAIDFVIGLLITLGASVLNALGLNVTKLDFTRQEALPASARKPDWQRPFWVLGLGLYIISQVVGSTLALNYLRAEYVAPLGSLSLVFNFVFAYLLVGTPVTRLDILGTIVVILGVVGVVVFGNNRQLPAGTFDKESNLTLSVLKGIWSRYEWIVYLIFLEVATVTLFWFSTIAHEVCMARIVDDRGEAGMNVDSAIEDMVGSGGGRRVSIPPTAWARFKDSTKKSHGFACRFLKRQLERWSQAKPESVIRRAAGFSWSVTAGVLAGQSLVFAKSGVKLMTIGWTHKGGNGEPNPFTSVLTYVILALLVVSAVSQVYCLNKALKCCDSTLSVPVLFATYTTCGFLNNLVYLDQLDSYKTWVFILIWLSILVLIIGVVFLSLKKPEPSHRSRSQSEPEIPTSNEPSAPEMEMKARQSGEGRTKRVGSTSEGAHKIKDVIIHTLQQTDGPALDGGKRQGSLGKVFGGMVEDAPQEVLEVVVQGGKGEMSRKERRRGAQKLGDEGDDEVDELDREGPVGKSPFDDEFGEFEEAPDAKP